MSYLVIYLFLMKMISTNEKVAAATPSLPQRNRVPNHASRAALEPAGSERFRTAKCGMSGAGKAVTGVNWESLLKKTILYASGHINRWYWRGSPDGVLPGGFDPNSLAAEAISELLQNPEQAHLPLDQIQRDLERRVRRHVNRLHHRAENRLVRNEPDLSPVTLDDGETISVTELIPEPSAQPDSALEQKESLDQFAEFKTSFSEFLGTGDGRREAAQSPKLRAACRVLTATAVSNPLNVPGFAGSSSSIPDDCSKTKDIASRLKLHPTTVKNLQRRFRKKWSQFHHCKSPVKNARTLKKL